MINEIIARFFKYHAGGDDKLYINFAWPYLCFGDHKLKRVSAASEPTI